MKKLAFQPHQIRREQLQPLKDSVIVSDMLFDARITTSGIYIPNDNGKSLGIRPRWGRVYAVGPEQQDVTPGQWICIEHGRWTRGTLIEDQEGEKTIRRIDANDILMVSNEPQQDETIGKGL